MFSGVENPGEPIGYIPKRLFETSNVLRANHIFYMGRIVLSKDELKGLLWMYQYLSQFEVRNLSVTDDDWDMLQLQDLMDVWGVSVPWHSAFTDDAILQSCDEFWSRIAEIMTQFLVITHDRVKHWKPAVDFNLNRKLQDGLIADNRTLLQSFWWKGRVYTPAATRNGPGVYGPPEEQWMVDNHKDYYRDCVTQMIQRWRERLGEGLSAEDSANLRGSVTDITLSLRVGESRPDEDHIDAIKSMSVAIAESLGHMYGLRIYYYRGMYDLGISIASRKPYYFHFVRPVSEPRPITTLNSEITRNNLEEPSLSAWTCANTNESVTRACDPFWTLIAEVMKQFLIDLHSVVPLMPPSKWAANGQPVLKLKFEHDQYNGRNPDRQWLE